MAEPTTGQIRPIDALLKAARRAAEARRADGNARLEDGPSILRGVHTNSGAYLMRALEEAGWTLVKQDEIDRTVGDLEDQLREERAALADLRQRMDPGAAEPTMDRHDRVMVALSRFIFPGIAVPRGEMADAVLAAVDDPEEFLSQLPPMSALYSADTWDLKQQIEARDERVLDLEADVKRLEDRERAAEQRVIAGEGSHQDTALVAIKLGEDLLEARTAISDHLANLCPGGSPRLYVVTVERLKAIVEAEGGGEHGA